jgi:hypothetical protein
LALADFVAADGRGQELHGLAPGDAEPGFLMPPQSPATIGEFALGLEVHPRGVLTVLLGDLDRPGDPFDVLLKLGIGELGDLVRVHARNLEPKDR